MMISDDLGWGLGWSPPRWRTLATPASTSLLPQPPTSPARRSSSMVARCTHARSPHTRAHAVGRPLRAYHAPPPRCCLSRPSSRASGSRSKVLAPDLRRYVLASSVGMPPSTSLSRLCSPHLHTETRSASSLQDRARTFILAKCTRHLPHCVLCGSPLERGAWSVLLQLARILCISTTPITNSLIHRS